MTNDITTYPYDMVKEMALRGELSDETIEAYNAFLVSSLSVPDLKDHNDYWEYEELLEDQEDPAVLRIYQPGHDRYAQFLRQMEEVKSKCLPLSPKGERKAARRAKKELQKDMKEIVEEIEARLNPDFSVKKLMKTLTK